MMVNRAEKTILLFVDLIPKLIDPISNIQ